MRAKKTEVTSLAGFFSPTQAHMGAGTQTHLGPRHTWLFNDVILDDEDTNSIQIDEAKKAIVGKWRHLVAIFAKLTPSNVLLVLPSTSWLILQGL